MLDAERGSIINIGSSSYMMQEDFFPGYAIAKSGVEGITRTLARTFGPSNVRVNTVLPGWVRTEMAERSARAEAQARGITAEQVWEERNGARYYHFVYKDVLFLLLSTEDPPKDTDALLETDPEYAAEIDQAYNAAKKAAHEGAPLDHIIELLTPVEEFAGKINISDEQVDYFRTVLADNQDVRWTFVLMHSPAWWTQTGYEIDPGNFTVIEKELSDRDYTVFAAHTHLYRHHERHGRDYITAAMTGALQVPQLGAIDHVIWVTMTKTGPKIANLLLNGILDKHGPVPGDHTTEFGMYQP